MTRPAPGVHTVLKIGGSLLAKAGAFDAAIEAVTAFRQGRRIVVVPGGGPFADAVRQMFRRARIGEDAAHWMAILGMEQYAHALAARLAGAELVATAAAIAAALDARQLPVLAPYQWLRAADPLPHSWEVTSDSIAAWFAGVLGARRIVLIKPTTEARPALVDAYFLRTLPRGMEHLVVSADDLGQLDLALRERPDERSERRAGEGP